MNMAFTTGCFFILQCIFLMDISEADPVIDVSSSEINVGITSSLDINCTFSLGNNPGMAAFISLVLSKANATGQDFSDLAAITEFSPDSVHLLSQELVSTAGVYSDTGESFLFLSWAYPTAGQAGVYKCSALGVDDIGRNVEMTNTSLVTVDKADINDVFDKLRQIENQIQNLETDKMSIKQEIQALQKDKTSLEQEIQALQNDKISIKQDIQTLKEDVTDLRLSVEYKPRTPVLGPPAFASTPSK